MFAHVKQIILYTSQYIPRAEKAVNPMVYNFVMPHPIIPPELCFPLRLNSFTNEIPAYGIH